MATMVAGNRSSFEREAAALLRKKGYLIFGLNGLSLYKFTNTQPNKRIPAREKKIAPKPSSTEQKGISPKKLVDMMKKGVQEFKDSFNDSYSKKLTKVTLPTPNIKSESPESGNDSLTGMLSHIQNTTDASLKIHQNIRDLLAKTNPVISQSEEKSNKRRWFGLSKNLPPFLSTFFKNFSAALDNDSDNDNLAADKENRARARRDKHQEAWHRRFFSLISNIRDRQNDGKGGLMKTLGGALGSLAGGLFSIVGGGLGGLMRMIFGGKGAVGLIGMLLPSIFGKGGLGRTIAGGIGSTVKSVFSPKIWKPILSGVKFVLIDLPMKLLRSSAAKFIGRSLLRILTGPAGMLALAATVGTLIGDFLWNNFLSEDTKKKISDLIGAGVETVLDAYRWVVGVVNKVVEGFGDAVKYVQKQWGRFKDLYNRVVDSVSHAIEDVANFFGELFDDPLGKMEGLKEKAWAGALAALSNLGAFVSEFVTSSFSWIKEKVSGWFSFDKDEPESASKTEKSAGWFDGLLGGDTNTQRNLVEAVTPSKTAPADATMTTVLPGTVSNPTLAPNAASTVVPDQMLIEEARKARDFNKPQVEPKKDTTEKPAPQQSMRGGGLSQSRMNPLHTNNLGLLIVQTGDF